MLWTVNSKYQIQDIIWGASPLLARRWACIDGTAALRNGWSLDVISWERNSSLGAPVKNKNFRNTAWQNLLNFMIYDQLWSSVMINYDLLLHYRYISCHGISINIIVSFSKHWKITLIVTLNHLCHSDPVVCNHRQESWNQSILPWPGKESRPPPGDLGLCAPPSSLWPSNGHRMKDHSHTHRSSWTLHSSDNHLKWFTLIMRISCEGTFIEKRKIKTKEVKWMKQWMYKQMNERM